MRMGADSNINGGTIATNNSGSEHIEKDRILPLIAQGRPATSMDTAIDLSDPTKALDLANIRFQLMYVQTPHLSHSTY